MRLAFVIAAVGLLAAAIAGARLTSGSGSATAAAAPLELRVGQLEAKVSGMCTAFRTFDYSRSFHDYDSRFQALIRRLQASCGGVRVQRGHEDSVRPKRRARHEDMPPPPAPHED